MEKRIFFAEVTLGTGPLVFRIHAINRFQRGLAKVRMLETGETET